MVYTAEFILVLLKKGVKQQGWHLFAEGNAGFVFASKGKKNLFIWVYEKM